MNPVSKGTVYVRRSSLPPQAWSSTNPYYLQTLTFIGINTLLALGLNMLMGYAGQISLGHAAFLASAPTARPF